MAYRLATWYSPYLAYVDDKIKRDPKLVEASMQQKLIAEPFGQKRLLDSSPLKSLPILIDGWDQCPGYEAQTQILQLIGEFISDYPSVPIL
ncbi:hypothetical protein P691DRAFT_806252 [Macrolepiota fuliginosa MF-IS2]|uniref:Uncharacterized protein n=1 Tax=Macrolepiota fuliginosa MF-IS2 TaxID=1400762 RepID=A0A9P5XJI7_9AGAR|nr:hypothetical protein P691DRAFT_806252 [Macrolepiota fuliginosa MF-IS2]